MKPENFLKEMNEVIRGGLSRVRDNPKPDWGDRIVYQHTNMWGDLCANIYEYTYAGAKGKYPDYTYRFARTGDGSIAPDSFEDIHIKSVDFIIGEQRVFGLVQKYNNLAKED